MQGYLPGPVSCVGVFPENRLLCTLHSEQKELEFYPFGATSETVFKINCTDTERFAILDHATFVCIIKDNTIRPYRTFGVRLTPYELDSKPLTISRIDNERFVVGNAIGELIFFSHNSGSKMRVYRRVNAHHRIPILSMSMHGSTLVAVQDRYCIMWCMDSFKKKASLKHRSSVQSVSVNDEVIVAGSINGHLFAHRNGGDFKKIAYFNNIHNKSAITSLHLLGSDLVLSTGLDGSIVFCNLKSKSVVLRMRTQITKIVDSAIIHRGQVAIVGEGKIGSNRIGGVVMLPPTGVKRALIEYSETMFNK